MRLADDAVLSALAGEILAPDIVDEVVAGVIAGLRPERSDRTRQRLEREQQRLDAEIERLTEAIAVGGELAPLLAGLAQRQARREPLDQEFREVAEAVTVDPHVLERAVRACLDDWRGLLARQTSHGRDFLRKVLTGPIEFTPVVQGRRKGYRFKGEASIGKLLSGVADLPTSLASPTGFNPFTVGGAVPRVA